MRCLNNTSFDIDQSIMFARILVLERKANKRMNFYPDIMFILEEVHS